MTHPKLRLWTCRPSKQLLRGVQRLTRRDADIRFDPHPFPICMSDGINGAGVRNSDHEMVVDSVIPYWVCPTTGCLAHYSGAL